VSWVFWLENKLIAKQHESAESFLSTAWLSLCQLSRQNESESSRSRHHHISWRFNHENHDHLSQMQWCQAQSHHDLACHLRRSVMKQQRETTSFLSHFLHRLVLWNFHHSSCHLKQRQQETDLTRHLHQSVMKQQHETTSLLLHLLHRSILQNLHHSSRHQEQHQRETANAAKQQEWDYW